jgi:hypothetical protein
MQVILEVRSSVQAISALEPHYRAQVVDAYAAALRVTFISTAFLAALATIIIIPVKVPRLGKRP